MITRQALWKGPKIWALAATAGVVFSLDLFFWHRCIHYVGPGVATILANFQVFPLALVGILWFRERLTLRFAVAVPMALSGLFLIVGWDWTAVGRDYQLGVLLGLITALCYAALTLILRASQSAPDRMGPEPNMAWVCLVGAVAAAGEVRLSGESFGIPDWSSVLALIAYGVLCSGLGWSFISRGLPHMPASRAGLVLILQPALAFIWDVLLFARPTSLVDVAGACVTLAAIYLGLTRES
jgi:drug/metabolite transporter (DMT)-like permease